MITNNGSKPEILINSNALIKVRLADGTIVDGIPEDFNWTIRNSLNDIIEWDFMHPTMPKQEDVGKHYRYSYRVNLSQRDMDNGYVDVKLDPYRICDIYNVGGGPLEHIAKKALRGVSKGHSKRDLIKELRACIDRWEEMLNEDGE